MTSTAQATDCETGDAEVPVREGNRLPTVLNESTLTLRQACRIGGRKLHRSTIYRWINRGIRGVRLESALRGGERVTSREALERFFEKINRNDSKNCRPPSRSPQTNRQAAQADAELAAEGL